MQVCVCVVACGCICVSVFTCIRVGNMVCIAVDVYVSVCFAEEGCMYVCLDVFV
jgi:hypothetical protein